MKIRLLFFAGLREALGRKEQVIEVEPGATLETLVARLHAELPALERYRSRLVISLNAQRRSFDTPLGDGDEVAFLPPMSGGSGERAWLQAQPLSLDVLLREVEGPEMGGIVTFVGTVRDHARGQSIDHLEYEAYEPMAEQELRDIVAEAQQRWPKARVAVAHRIGRLAIGEAAVMVVASAPHRAEAFEACRYTIDTLKQRVPIWKKEFATSGSYWVEENP